MRLRLFSVMFGILLVVTPFFAPNGTTRAKSASDETSAEPTANASATMPNFDIRRDPESRVINGFNMLAASKRGVDRSAAIRALESEVPTSDLNTIKIENHDSGIPKIVSVTEGFLTGRQVGSAEVIARSYLARHAGALGLSARDLRNLKLTVNNPDSNIGVTYLKFEQNVKGVPVFDSEIGVTITGNGEIATVFTAQHIPNVSVSTNAVLTPEQGIARAFEHCGVTVDASMIQPSSNKRIVDSNGFTFYASPLGEGHEDIMFQKTVVNVGGNPVLAYRAYVDKNGTEWYDTLVDANTGELLIRYNIVSDVQGQVFTSNPGISLGNSRTTVQIAPLFGVTDPWVGSGTVSTGNNADAYIDRDANNAPDSTTTTSTGTNPGLTSGRADTTKATPAGEFTFVYSNTNAPTVQQANAVTNLWYFNNYMHDWMYSLGFTESARNFQTNNFGRGGAQADAVKAEAQDGSGTNNANFATPADGGAGRMQQYIFTAPNPDRDSDLDGDVVMHEYGHGVSNRLIGNGSGLGGTQSGAMGEGWGDYWASSNFNDGVMGEYVVQSSAGIRRAVYSVPAATVHDSYADVGNSGFEVHDDGEVWAACLWDINRTIGKTKTDMIVLNGMKNTPSSPSMVSARSGIITACNTLYPADVCSVWTVFARHGLGNSASGNDGTSHVAATDMPSSCSGGCSFSISPTSSSPGAGATTGSVSVTAGSGCAWTATSNASFLTITSGASGSGNGTVGYSVAANTGGARTGTLTIAGQNFTVNQAAGTTGCSSDNGSITPGTPVNGILATTDCTSTIRTGGRFYDNFTFAATAGTTYTITMNSTAFDTYLHLLSGGVSVAFDDDGNGGTNSKITYTPSSSGNLTVHATSYSAGSTGAYTVSVTGGGGGGTIVLSEGAESGAAGWTVSTNATGNNWVISANGRATGANGFRSNNATATYPNNLDQSLISPAFSLSGKTAASLTYNYKQQTETNYDFLRVEISTNGGSTWTSLSAVSTNSTGFTTTAGAGMVAKTISLNSYAGQANVKVRFRLTSDVSVVFWGAAVDDIAVTAN